VHFISLSLLAKMMAREASPQANLPKTIPPFNLDIPPFNLDIPPFNLDIVITS